MKRTDLRELASSGAADKDVATYDAATNRWAPKAASAGSSSLTVQDENGNVATGVTQLDFQGAGVTATAGTGEVVVTIPSSGGSAQTYEQAVTALPGKVHRWKFDEASGSTVADVVGSLPLTLAGTYTRDVNSLTGKAVNLGAGSSAISSGLGSIPVGNAARCFVALYRYAGDTAKAAVFGYGTGATRQWFVGGLNSGANVRLAMLTWLDDLNMDGVDASNGGWHMSAFGYDGKYSYVFHDGALAARRLGGALTTTTTGNFTVGGAVDGQFLGDFDDFTVLNNWPGKAKLMTVYNSLLAL